jgi:hypothetical protein
VITAITPGEIRAGVALLPAGRRRGRSGNEWRPQIAETFAGQVPAFGDRRPRRSLLSVSVALATRNTADFDGVRIEVFNPRRPV